MIWSVDLKDLKKKLSLFDTRSKTGTYVLRTVFIEKLARLNKVIFLKDLEVLDPKNRKKAEKYYVVVMKKNADGEHHALIEMGYGGCRIIAVSQDLKDLDGEAIIDFFEDLVKTQKGHGELMVTENFILSTIRKNN